MTLRIALLARAGNQAVRRLPKGIRIAKLTDRQLEKIAEEMEMENKAAFSATRRKEAPYLKAL